MTWLDWFVLWLVLVGLLWLPLKVWSVRRRQAPGEVLIEQRDREHDYLIGAIEKMGAVEDAARAMPTRSSELNQALTDLDKMRLDWFMRDVRLPPMPSGQHHLNWRVRDGVKQHKLWLSGTPEPDEWQTSELKITTT